MRKDGQTEVIPMHRPIKAETLKGIIEQAGLMIEEFVGQL